MRARFHVVLLLLTFTASARTQDEPAAENRLALLKREADEVLAFPNVEARDHVDVLFRVSLELEQEAPAEALRYLSEGLKLYPWNLQQQLRYTRLLKASGNAQLAADRARIIETYAEDDDLVLAARRVLSPDAAAPAPVAKLEPMPGKSPTLVLVDLDGTQPLLIPALAERLGKHLGIPVHARALAFDFGKAGRHPLDVWMHSLRAHLRDFWDEKAVAQAMADAGVRQKELADPEKVITVYRRLLEANQPAAVDEFLAIAEEVRSQPKMWDADALLDRLEPLLKPLEQPGLRFVCVTSRDIYAKEYHFVFGQDRAPLAVLSYARFLASANDEPPRRERLEKRTVFQLLASAGHVYKVARCSDPTCARAYPNSLAEHDAKEERLCRECSLGFDKAFGR